MASVLGGLALGAACGVLAAAFGNVISSSAVGAELTVVIASALGGCFAWQG